ncbi:WhiB family transcriptional regulator [Streptomyces sp. AV19]|uniref:WhiB family transcriptional regulator n=1 Tax=Streptomyces sp. AV19 TaxID=2793068 RepID=UPI0018FEC41D|nr:WhiB family transcriptional regulator [Streptomyces sp. AV19]MBH1938997.1 WhiB family transcriptional regulator [Streptomyces sp. AV19]MDG4536867.1 WhiB family transcriptional regulator [Streptomyces sp. AV19]
MTSKITSSSSVVTDSHCTEPASALGPLRLVRWFAEAACTDVDDEIFFSTGHNLKRIEFARIICGRCPVTAQCLEHAETMPERFGIWGGTTPLERGWDAYGKRIKAKASSHLMTVQKGVSLPDQPVV